jgi:hypothetical protein
MFGRNEESIVDLVYAPKDDITTNELANVIKVIVAATAYGPKSSKGIWESLPSKSKRHFYLQARKD